MFKSYSEDVEIVGSINIDTCSNININVDEEKIINFIDKKAQNIEVNNSDSDSDSDSNSDHDNNTSDTDIVDVESDDDDKNTDT